jgi:FkbM family methyltransferase
MRGAAAIKPDIFIDVGANLGLYTCILMKNRLVPRAILFEPDRRNRVHLGANLLINGLFDANLEIHPVALGAEPGRFRLVPGPERDIGLSQIVETAPEGHGYDVEVVRFDDFVTLTGQALAIKIDVERYERKVLGGMARTLRDKSRLGANRSTGSARGDYQADDRSRISTRPRFRTQSRFPERLSASSWPDLFRARA